MIPQDVTEILREVAPSVTYQEIHKFGYAWHSWYIVDPENKDDEGARLEISVHRGRLEDTDWRGVTVPSWKAERQFRLSKAKAA